jgi:hypothetical protein
MTFFAPSPIEGASIMTPNAGSSKTAVPLLLAVTVTSPSMPQLSAIWAAAGDWPENNPSKDVPIRPDDRRKPRAEQSSAVTLSPELKLNKFCN